MDGTNDIDDGTVGTPFVIAVEDPIDGEFVALETGLNVWFDIESGWVVLPMGNTEKTIEGLQMLMDFVRQEAV